MEIEDIWHDYVKSSAEKKQPKGTIAFVKRAEGNFSGPYFLKDLDPYFHIASLESRQSFYRGDTLIIRREEEFEFRPIVGVTLELVIGAIIVTAPKQVEKPNPGKEFLIWGGTEFRPGTVFLGGRDSGFYDGEGIILKAEHIGGDIRRNEDWAFYVLGPSDLRRLAPQWLLFDLVGPPISGPSFLMDFFIPEERQMGALLEAGETELLQYFANHPAKIDNLSPRVFEDLMAAIYRNLGFDVEQIGSWNQADGGVDLIAVQKSGINSTTRLAIQCKASKNKISARPIRELAGVLDGFKAHKGVVATTSRFTSPAKKETESNLWKISLEDRDSIVRQVLAIMKPNFKSFIENIPD